MKRMFTILILLFPLWATAQSVVEHLSDQIRWMEEGDSIELHYSFVGCFGPYHQGVITLSLDQDAVSFHSESFNEKGQNRMAEAGASNRSDLLQALIDAQKRHAQEVLGNVINFKVLSAGRLLSSGTDHITQKHFVEVFHPYTSAINSSPEFAIPKVSSGGFVH